MKQSSIHSDFWLDEFDDFDSTVAVDSTTRLIRLNMSRRAVANFVSILTGKNIPVLFNDNGDNMTDGNVVYLSSDIGDPEDFDSLVGLALHEGSHVLLSDFRLVVDLWQNIPRSLYNIAEPKGFSKTDVASFLKTILNVIEDRYIDQFVYTNAPGYRGYYLALYDKFFNNKNIDMMLKSQMYRSSTLQSYESRLINLTNPNTDLDALPEFRKIAELISISTINRLKTPQDRLDLAIKVCELIYTNIDSDQQKMENGNSKDENSKNDEGGTTLVIGSDEPNGKSSSSSDSAESIIGGLTTSVVSPNSNSEDVTKKANEQSGVSKNKRESIDRALKKQKIFVLGNIKKSKISATENRILASLDNAGVTIVNVGTNIADDNSPTPGVDCIVVKNFNRELVFSDICPCVDYDVHKNPNADTKMAVERGVQLGILLGKRLSIRSEINTTKYMRKSMGKIDRRVLSELGFDNDNVFYRIETDLYKKAFIHISVDASASMSGKKWTNTITCVTAICKAASMISNIRVSVSIRTTSHTSGNPYIAMVYDSSKDSFAKVVNLFPYLSCTGSTPEGLCFEAIMDQLKDRGENEDYYFLNFSDGEPAYCYNKNNTYISYSSVNGSKHTRKQVGTIREKGYKVMSYFISEYKQTLKNYSDPSVTCFKTMYGKDSRFIDVTNVISVAKTMNDMFLNSDSKI
jgi:hypothetical protein